MTILGRLAESVAASLEGQALGSFTRVSTAVRVAVEAALTRILTPKRSIDILREVRLLSQPAEMIHLQSEQLGFLKCES